MTLFNHSVKAIQHHGLQHSISYNKHSKYNVNFLTNRMKKETINSNKDLIR